MSRYYKRRMDHKCAAIIMICKLLTNKNRPIVGGGQIIWVLPNTKHEVKIYPHWVTESV